MAPVNFSGFSVGHGVHSGASTRLFGRLCVAPLEVEPLTMPGTDTEVTLESEDLAT